MADNLVAVPGDPTWQWSNQTMPDGVRVGAGVGAITVQDYPTAPYRPYVFVIGRDGNLWVNWWP